MDKEKNATITIPTQFKRCAYFGGMLLTELDFGHEQTYFRDKLKLHNRLHGKGVVNGLKVDAGPDKDPAEPVVTITPGFAIDCDGNEVIVSQAHEVKLAESIKYMKSHGTLKEPFSLIVGIAYSECLSDSSPQYITSCSDVGDTHYSRVREGFYVTVMSVNQDEKYGIAIVLNRDSSIGDCLNSDRCGEKELLVPLAKICVDVNGTDKKIEPKAITDQREYAWAFPGWEEARKKVLSSLGLHDISIIIGQKAENAKEMLKKNKITVSTPDKSLSDLGKDTTVFDHIRNAHSIIAEGSVITLIVDDEKNVLFGFVKT